MIGMKLVQAKGGFFDSDKVQKSMDRATIRALSKFGAFVRRRARSSIRKRKASSLPGHPPSSHTGLLRDNIYFAAEGTQNVVIGAVRLNQLAFDGAGQVSSEGVPALLEYGGTQTLFEEWTGERWRRIDARFLGNKANILELQQSERSNLFQANARRQRPTRKRQATYEARPYMQPAFDEELDRAPYLWENGIAA